MTIVERIIDILAERLFPIVGGLLSSRFETIATLAQAEQQDELEERARQFEQEGKPLLAAALRERALKIVPDDPGQQGVRILRQLDGQHVASQRPVIAFRESATETEVSNSKDESGPVPPQSAERRVRRPTNRHH